MLGWIAARWRANLPTAQDNMQWQMLRILLIFRMLHLGQLTVTAPALLADSATAAVSLPVYFVVAAESVFFGVFLLRVKAYRRFSVVVVEIGTAVALLLYSAMLLPAGDRAAWAAPLLVLTTEQISGVAIASAVSGRRRLLVVSTALVAGSYMVLIGAGSLAALGNADVLIGITGYVALAVLIRMGAVFLLGTARQIEELATKIAADQQREALQLELHNYIDRVLADLSELDAGQINDLAALRSEAATARERLRSYIELGVFDQPTTLAGMVNRQITQAHVSGLNVFSAIRSAREKDISLTDGQLTLVENALRAVLLNIRVHAGVREAMLTTSVTECPRLTLWLSVVDRGRGFDADALAEVAPRTGSLGGHRLALKEAGGDLSIESEPGHTRVVISVPVLVGAYR